MRKFHTRTLLTVLTLVAASALLAQAPNRGPRKRPNRANFARGRSMMMYMGMLGQFDKNNDMQIEENELRSGLEQLGQKAAKAYALLLAMFDANKNGKIDPAEGRKIQEFIQIIQMTRPLDTNHDWKISDQELSAAWDKLAAMAQRRNDFILKRFDKNHDGKLDPAELAAAKKQMDRWRRWGRRGGRRAPRPGNNPRGLKKQH